MFEQLSDDSDFCEFPRKPTAKLWRYMEFEKLLDYLERRALFFSCADKLGDDLEGSLPPGYDEFVDAIHRRTGERIDPDDDRRARAEQLQLVRRLSLVSSWHSSEHESYAMWRLFMPDKQGVAIQTTVSRFQEALRRQKFTTYLCRVRYLKSPYIRRSHHLSLLTCKDAAFSYEREVRAIVDLFEDLVRTPKLERSERNQIIDNLVQEGGYHVPIDPADLIEHVVVSPGSQRWFKELVKNILPRYGLNQGFSVSALERTPQF